MYATSGCEGIPARTEPGKEPYSPLETAWDVVDVFGTQARELNRGVWDRLRCSLFVCWT